MKVRFVLIAVLVLSLVGALLKSHADRLRAAAEERAAAKDAPEYVSQLLERFQALAKECKWDQALKVARRARDLDPDDPAVDLAVNVGALVIEQRSSATDPCPNKDTCRERYLECKLRQPINVNFKDTELQQAIADLREITKLDIVADKAALDEAGIRLDQPITLKVENVSLKSALNLLLRDIHLTYEVRNEYVCITTSEAVKNKLVRVVYNVADLVIPIDDHGAVKNLNDAAARHGKGVTSDPDKVSSTADPQDQPGGKTNLGAAFGTKSTSKSVVDESLSLPDRLMQLITSTVAQDTWASVGGKGTIAHFPLGMALVIHQTREIQDDIITLLAALRRLQDVEVTLELRIIKMTRSTRERLDADLNLADARDLHVAYLDANPRDSFLKVVQSDGAAHILQAPKVTLFNGQGASVRSVEEQVVVTGFEAKEKDGEPVLEPQHQAVQHGYQVAFRPLLVDGGVRLHVQARLDYLDPDSLTRVPLSVPLADEDGEKKTLTVHVQQPRTATLSLDRTLHIPTGQSALLACGHLKERIRNGNCPDLLRDIPVLDWLVRNLADDAPDMEVMILITPRKIENANQ